VVQKRASFRDFERKIRRCDFHDGISRLLYLRVQEPGGQTGLASFEVLPQLASPADWAATAADELFAAPRRVAGFYGRSWFDWAGSRGHKDQVPVPLPTLAIAAQAALDEAVVALFKTSQRPRPPAVVGRILGEVTAAIDLYGSFGWLADPSSFFLPPPPLTAPRLSRHRFGGLSFERVKFPSEYEPHPEEPGRDRWLGYRANRTAHAWLIRHDEARPWLVCIHGAGMGAPAMDFTGFHAGWLHRQLGLNLAFPVLPLHGPRRDGIGVGVGFPTDDLLDTIHGIAQAVWDARRIIGWVRGQGDEVVGVKGLSLGGYASAVLASVEDDLACVIAGIPAVDFAELISRHAPSRLFRRPEYQSLRDMGRRVQQVISPLALEPRLPRERRFIYAGMADRLVSPRRQVRELWDHWDQPRISWFEGGHIGFLWSAQVRAFVQEALAESGLIATASPAQ
jgi:hypothetical protein